MIRRDVEAAARDRYDLVVVGGGVYGIALTLEAARHGMRPLLVERADFGGATSWNSLRIVHGGLRALQTLDLARFQAMVAERRWWLTHFPDLVEPLPCLMPIYGSGLHRPAVMRAALTVNDLLSWRRNRGVREDRRIPSARVLGPDETLRACSQLERHNLAGAALWHDAVMPDSHRLLIEMLHWATSRGAVALNYVEATGLHSRQGRVAELDLEDLATSRSFRVETSSVVNCAGPWCREVAERFDRDVPELFGFSIAFNALFDRQPQFETAVAVAPPRPGGRTYFLHPWKGRLLAGTFHAPSRGPQGEARDDEGLLDRFLADLNAALPALELRRTEVSRVFQGFLPAQRPGSDALALREVIRHHGDFGGPAGLFSVSGVKFTTAHRVAEKTLRRVNRWRRNGSSRLDDRPRPPSASCISWPRLEDLMQADGAAARDYVRHLADEESVVHLGDLMLRRTDWGLDPGLLLARAERVARLMAWDPDSVVRELQRLQAAESAPSARSTS